MVAQPTQAPQTTPVPSYPLSVTAATFFSAARLVRQTGSYPRERALAVAGMGGVLTGVLVLTVALTAVLTMYVHKAAGGVVFLLGCLGLVFVLMPAMERRFFAMRCAFAWLITEALLQRAPIPASGTSDAARQFIADRFGDVAGPVYEAHMNVRRTVSTFFRTFNRLGELLPLDIGPLRNALGFIVDRVAPHIADLALSHALTTPGRDYATAADDAVTYVAQNPRAILGTAVRAWITERLVGSLVGGLTLVVLGGATFAAVLAATTHTAATSGVPTEGAQVMGIFAAVFAAVFVAGPFAWLASWFIRTAFLEPVSLTMLVIRFHSTIQGQAVDPSIRARLHQARRPVTGLRGLASLLE